MKEGYRHIDCALIYKNEAEVGEGIKRSGVPREEIFITGKLWNTFHPNVAESLRRSLEDLGTDYLDLYVSVFADKFAQQDIFKSLFESQRRSFDDFLRLVLVGCGVDETLTGVQLIHWPVRLVPVSILSEVLHDLLIQGRN